MYAFRGFLGVAALLAIIGAIYLGVRHQMPALIWGAVIFGGTLMAIASAGPIISGRLVERDEETNRPTLHYYGPSARLLGLSGLMVGAGVIALGIAQLLGVGPAILDYLKTRPGVAMVAGGAWFVCSAIPHLIGAREENLAHSRWNFMVSLPGRLIALLFLVLALGAIALGLFEIAAPAEFDRLSAEWVGLR